MAEHTVIGPAVFAEARHIPPFNGTVIVTDAEGGILIYRANSMTTAEQIAAAFRVDAKGEDFDNA